MHYKAIELGSGRTLLRHSYFPELEPCLAPPIEFWRKELLPLVRFGHKHFPAKNSVIAMPDGTLVFLQQVGRNASNHFGIGQSQNGRVFRADGYEEALKTDELREGESCTYLGKNMFLVWRDYLYELTPEKMRRVQTSYWGHA